MATLNRKIKEYLKDNSKTYEVEQNNYVLRNDGSEDYIESWNVSDLAEPTAEQLASYETAANISETLNVVLSKRKKEYLSWQQQMEMIYKDQKNGTTTFKDHCDKVRSDNPKD
tara:strand:- start:144 stop:482 length:339 start_codon:yes stop_codon:yes gene_type:complete